MGNLRSSPIESIGGVYALQLASLSQCTQPTCQVGRRAGEQGGQAGKRAVVGA